MPKRINVYGVGCSEPILEGDEEYEGIDRVVFSNGWLVLKQDGFTTDIIIPANDGDNRIRLIGDIKREHK